MVDAEVHRQDEGGEGDAADDEEDYPLDDDDLEYADNNDEEEEELSQEELQDPDFNIEEHGGRVIGTARIQVHIVSSG